LLGQAEPVDREPDDSATVICVDADKQDPTTESLDLCPECRKGRLLAIAPLPVKPVLFLDSWSFDSS